MKVFAFIGRIFFRHLRVGYVSGLAFFDILALALIAVDVIRYAELSLSSKAAFVLIPEEISYEATIKSIAVLISFVLVAPIANAIILSFIGTGRLTRVAFGKVKGSLVALHILSAVIIAFTPFLFEPMQVISGYRLNSGILTYSFVPLFQPWLIWLAYLPYGALPIEIIMAFSASLAHKAAEGGRLDILYDYSTRLILADLRGDLHPLGGRKKLNFNTAAISPEIRYIKERAHYLVQEYQEFVPGSKEAEECLLVAYKEVDQLLRRLLLKSSRSENVNLEILPGTSRALEISLSRLQNLRTVVLSPFEHPVEAKVVEWMRDHRGTDFRRLSLRPNDYLLPWNEQEEILLSQLESQDLSSVDTNAFVISQVCYATGRVIPIRALVDRIQQQYVGYDIRVIIDAAHYVGNGHYVEELDCTESYVFSTHKWLLSPEPAGIILTHKNEKPTLRPYDAWQSMRPTSLPSTTSSVRSIMGLRASLELINRVGFGSLFMRSSKLRDYFKNRISFRFQIVGDLSGLSETFMFGIRPRPGFHWRYEDPNSLREYFIGQLVSVLVITIGDDVPWVRVSFPYFLEVQQVRELLRILNQAVAND